MKVHAILLGCGLAVCGLTHCASEGPPPAGSIRLVDPVAVAYNNKAKAAESRKDWKGAIKQYNYMIERCPLAQETPAARFRIGQLYEMRNEPMDAFDAYQKLVEKHHGSELYKAALDRQLAIALAAANGTLKNKVFWLWDVNMDPAVVTKWLRSIRDNAPYNDLAAMTTYVLGKYLIDRDRPEEARMAYQKLVEDYPQSKYAPEALLMVARIWSDSHTKGNQNQVNLSNAQEAYEEFCLRFPDHPDAKKAREGVSSMRSLLVRQQLEVGEYYLFRARDTVAAVFCFEDVIRNEAQNPEAAAKARKHLAALRGRAAKQEAATAKAEKQ